MGDFNLLLLFILSEGRGDFGEKLQIRIQRPEKNKINQFSELT